MWSIFKKPSGDDKLLSIKHNDGSSSSEETGLIEISKGMLADVRAELSSENTLRVPIAQLSTLGAGVASLLPALNTVTQTTTMNTSGLFRLANASLEDTLKLAKDGNYWAAFHKADGGSKFVKLQQAGPISTTTNTVMPINPATMMMAVALASVEKKLDGIMKMQEQILSFLEREKEAEIEADMETLVGMMTTYKFNWDNSSYLASNHKMVLDIKHTARKTLSSIKKRHKSKQIMKDWLRRKLN